MRSIREISETQCRALTHLFCDIDDTMTEEGLLPSGAYDALWRLTEAGIAVVPVTGRPGGWCDMIARMWPVAGVVGENGAFYFSYDRTARRMERVVLSDQLDQTASGRHVPSPGNQPRTQNAGPENQPPPGNHAAPESGAPERPNAHPAMLRARDRVLREVPGTAVAADQPYRVTDIAIDFCEDVPPLSDAEVRRIGEILEEERLHYKVSSIHVNFWRGDHDKVSCVERFVSDRLGGALDEQGEQLIFIGDSPNDEPLFARLPLSIGVANVRRFAEQMNALPTFVTGSDSAKGFCEAVSTILERR